MFKGVGVSLLILSDFFIIRIFKNGGQESESPAPPPPVWIRHCIISFGCTFKI